jgi:uncharacterized iron-regulated protein
MAILTFAIADTSRAEALAGRIWAPAEARFVSPAAVTEAARAAPFVLLGETHTVPRHHALQARLIRAIAGDGRRPPVVLEMVGRDRQADIDAWRRDSPPDADAFGDAVEWTERGWPPWHEYRPIVDAALAHDLAIRAGGPPDTLVRRVAEQGPGALGDPAAADFPGLDTPLDPASERRLRTTLERAHCGLAAHAPIERMIAIQRLRDASMAGTMIDADQGGGAILIAGHGHVRRDYGVPVYLQRGVPERALVTIAFMGTRGRSGIAEQRDAAGGSLPFDFVWFTEGGASGPDCADDDGDASGH